MEVNILINLILVIMGGWIEVYINSSWRLTVLHLVMKGY